MELKELIENMSGVKDGNEPIGNKTLSWEAYRVAEKLNDTNLIAELKAYIKDDNNETTRTYAYNLLGYIGVNAKASEVTDILIDQIKREDIHLDNLHNILDVLYSTNFPLQKGLEEILIYAFDERELIRTTAIQLLSRYTIEHQKIKNTLLEIIKYHYDEYDLKYAVESLQVLFPNDYRKWVFRIKEDLINNNGDKIIIDRISNII
ncbi:hypothetical protein IWQ47_000151 [Aquimarina sp. EL_43]|uniref:hypothetical protein n=1 Tax=unclassified Aquimarina TaxID=2627091 RepID=UPI0018CA24B1|nr:MULTISPECIES: hypothetical protein [unclassified Aquimarina]MBG6129157.1 hypothetical protein [Aquimarina sp. EL_35]MBG6150222.1 hypothetical protein [Aquimarina sp. EL_32]MBG6167093.1 hypothetical protein [Aquimarina sp. EL_43]